MILFLVVLELPSNHPDISWFKNKKKGRVHYGNKKSQRRIKKGKNYL